jgi:antitoxin VapB
MSTKAKVFVTGHSQAVRLPMEFRFDCSEVYIHRDLVTGDVILSRRPDSWDDFFASDGATGVPTDFMSESDRQQDTYTRITDGIKS